MKKAKYVIIDGSAIVFSPAILHKDMVGYHEKAEAAGFVTFSIIQDEYGESVVIAKAFGESISLGVGSRPEDSEIITIQICNK